VNWRNHWEAFFDEIPHEPLLDAVAARVADGSVLWGGAAVHRFGIDPVL
jgi:hypothetical protein